MDVLKEQVDRNDGSAEQFSFKTCPVCHAKVFGDMDVCYGCMHRFPGEELNMLLPDVPAPTPTTLTEATVQAKRTEEDRFAHCKHAAISSRDKPNSVLDGLTDGKGVGLTMRMAVLQDGETLYSWDVPLMESALNNPR